MKSRINQLVAVMAIIAVAGALFTGSVLAQSDTPAEGAQNDPGVGQMFGGMMGEMDQETWGEMIQHMNEIHGPELTGKMIQRMNEGNHCSEDGGFQGMMGDGFEGMMGNGFGRMMGWGFNGPGSMMGSQAGQ